ncbi:MAG TPA: hypothetical protein VIL23_02995 [Clostridia bacterium]
MKKVKFLLSFILVMIMLWGCAAPAAYINFTQPWHKTYENSEYDVSFYYYLQDAGSIPSEHKDKIIKDSLDQEERIEIADGKLQYTIEQDDAQKHTWKLTASLEITYLSEEELKNILDKEYDNFKNALPLTGITKLGAVDTMTSTVVFSMEKGKLYQPLKVTKEFDMPSANISLEYAFDYQTYTFNYKLNDQKNTITYKAKKIKSGYDNEQLLLLIRSIDKDSFVAGYSANLARVYNWTDAADSKGLLMANSINIHVQNDLKSIPITDEFLPFAKDVKQIDNENRLGVYEVKIYKSSTYESGPALTAWYAQMDITADGSYATRLMIKNVQNIYNVTTAKKAFCISYDITSLKIA